MSEGHPGRRRFVIGGFLAFGGVYAAVVNAGGVADAVDAFDRANGRLLALAGAAQLVNYLLLGLLLRRLVASTSAVCTPLTAVRMAFVLNGLGNVMPAAPAEGIALTRLEMLRRNVEPRRATLALSFVKWYTTRALFAVFALDALVIVAISEVRYPSTFPDRATLAVLAGATVVVLGTTAWLVQRRATSEFVSYASRRALFWRPQAPTEQLRAAGAQWHADARELLGGRRRRMFVGAVAVLACIADVECFRFALRSMDIHLQPWWFVLTYVVAQMATLIPFLPAGIGAVETLVPALLRGAHVPGAVALAGVFAYRLVATIAPAVLGVLALVRLRVARIDLPAAEGAEHVSGDAPARPPYERDGVQRDPTSGDQAPGGNSSTSRSAGKRNHHDPATTSVATPPSTTAPPAPSS